jgi:hypothetical protein
MKKFIFALTFILAPCAVNAGQLLPNLYAFEFCKMRAAGLSVQDSMRVATEEAYISSGEAVKVTWHGKLVDSDILQAMIAISKLCPKYMK